MSILAELNTTLSPTGVPIETGAFTGSPPDEYIVLTPLLDSLEGYADNQPQEEIQEVRVSLFVKGNFLFRKMEMVRLLLKAGITITENRYIGREDDTGYNHYAIDVAKNYTWEE